MPPDTYPQIDPAVWQAIIAYQQMLNRAGDKADSPADMFRNAQYGYDRTTDTMTDPWSIVASGAYDPMAFVPNEPTVDNSGAPATPTLYQAAKSSDPIVKGIYAAVVNDGAMMPEILSDLQQTDASGKQAFDLADPISKAKYDAYVSAAQKMIDEHSAMASYTPKVTEAEQPPLVQFLKDAGLPSPFETYTAENFPGPTAGKMQDAAARMEALQAKAAEYLASRPQQQTQKYGDQLMARQRYDREQEVKRLTEQLADSKKTGFRRAWDKFTAMPDGVDWGSVGKFAAIAAVPGAAGAVSGGRKLYDWGTTPTSDADLQKQLDAAIKALAQTNTPTKTTTGATGGPPAATGWGYGNQDYTQDPEYQRMFGTAMEQTRNDYLDALFAQRELAKHAVTAGRRPLTDTINQRLNYATQVYGVPPAR